MCILAILGQANRVGCQYWPFWDRQTNRVGLTHVCHLGVGEMGVGLGLLLGKLDHVTVEVEQLFFRNVPVLCKTSHRV